MSRRTRNHSKVTFLLIMVLAVIGCRKAPPPPAPVTNSLQLVPSDALFCVRVFSPQQALDQLDQYLTGVAPLPPGMLVRMKMGELLGNPQLTGVDLNRDLIIFGRATSSHAADFALAMLLPITDPVVFRENSPQCQATNDRAVMVLEQPSLPPLYFVALANYVLVCPDVEQLDELRSQLAHLSHGTGTSLADNTQATSATGPFWIHADIPQIRRYYHETLQNGLAFLRQQMELASQASPTMQQSVSSSRMGLDLLAQLLEIGLTQLESINISIVPNVDILRITPTVAAQSDSPLAQALSLSAPLAERDLLPFLHPQATMNLWMDTRVTTNPLWDDILQDWLAPTLDKTQRKTVGQLVNEARDIFAGAAISSMQVMPNQSPWFALFYVLPIKSRSAYEQFLDRALTQVKALDLQQWYKEQFGIALSFSYEKATEQYQGIALDTATLTLDTADTNDAFQNEFERLYGGGFRYRFAALDQQLLMAVGPDADQVIRNMIDQAQQKTNHSVPVEFEQALANVPELEQAHFVATYNYLRIMAIVSTLTATNLPVIPVQSQSNLVFAGRIHDQQAALDIIIPKQHLIELIQYTTAMQMQLMQQPPQEPPAPPADQP